MSNGNVVNLFKEKASVIPEGESPEETVARFHSKLDEVLEEFPSLSPFDKYMVMESVVEMNRNIFKLYFDLKKRHDFHMNNY